MSLQLARHGVSEEVGEQVITGIVDRALADSSDVECAAHVEGPWVVGIEVCEGERIHDPGEDRQAAGERL